MTTETEIREARLPGDLFRGMGVLYLRCRPGASRESLAGALRADLANRGVHYHVRSLKRQLSGSVSTVPPSVQETMRDLLLRDTELKSPADIEFALWTAGLAVSPDRRRAAYVATARILPLARLWLTLNPTRSRRSLAVVLSRRLAHRGIGLKVGPLQVVLGGRQPGARREIVDELLSLLATHGIASESDALKRCRHYAGDIAGRAADRALEPVARLKTLALAWQVHTRNPSLRQLALLLRNRLKAHGLDLGVARIQVGLAGRAKTVRAALVGEMEILLGEVLPEDQNPSVAVAQAISDRTRLDDLRWVDAPRIAMLARRWLAMHPDSSMRQLAIRVADTVQALGYAISSNTVQPILGGHKKKARGYVYRALRRQFPDHRESLPAMRTRPSDRHEPAVSAVISRGVEPAARRARSTGADWNTP